MSASSRTWSASSSVCSSPLPFGRAPSSLTGIPPGVGWWSEDYLPNDQEMSRWGGSGVWRWRRPSRLRHTQAVTCQPAPARSRRTALTELPDDFQTAPLAEVDPDIARVLERELARQQSTLEMIASENFVPQAVLDAAGSVLTNKYAEGYPGRRYYGGCEEVDVARAARDRPGEGAVRRRARERPAARRRAGQQRGLHGAARAGRHDHGHGARPRRPSHARDEAERLGKALRGRGVPREPEDDYRVDMEEVERLAHEHKPKVIVAGWSAYPRQLDFAAFREIADAVGAKLMVRHGALRRARRGGRAPEPRRARARDHHDDPQDAVRPAQRDDPLRARSFRRTSTGRSSPASRAAR